MYLVAFSFFATSIHPPARRQVSTAEDPDPAYQVRPGEADRSRAESGVRAAAARGGEVIQTRVTSTPHGDSS